MDKHAIDITHRTVILPLLYLMERDFGQAPENTIELVYSKKEVLYSLYAKAIKEVDGNPTLTEHDARRSAIQSMVDLLSREKRWPRVPYELQDDKIVLGRMYEIEKMVDAMRDKSP